MMTATIGTLTVDDDGQHDPAVMDVEGSDCMICEAPTDHVSGVCDRCNEPDDDVECVMDGVVMTGYSLDDAA